MFVPNHLKIPQNPFFSKIPKISKKSPDTLKILKKIRLFVSRTTAKWRMRVIDVKEQSKFDWFN